ncbi:probable cyclin-dependent serine/threonine-protein kinase DDB_G0292550 [Neltuma alba]|uniref:probable cyclin-dependent serine/threonine-protein kinase DDB_G0292550 n=1 Tax=Neltuma alba TaxID=207710 RepID=UPI0010A4D65E|nr:probable cyclin-dependent serine/threonine-protein kinase DDB_G0292550 [Prosopis alba]
MLQKYRMFLKKIADKGILEGLSERALRSRFAMGLPTDLIRDLQKRASRFRHYEHYHYQPYSTVAMPQIPHNPPTTRFSLANQTVLGQPNHYGTNHHRPIVNGGLMTSANSLTANGLMSNYSSLGNSGNFNYGPSNYDNHNNSLGMIMPYGSSGFQRSPWTYNNHLGTHVNNNDNNRGMIVPYGSSGLQRCSSTYNNHHGTQLNNNPSLTVGALNRVHNNSYNYSSSSNIFGLSNNGNASNNAIVPVSSSAVNARVEPTRSNISAGLPSLPQQSINGSRNAVGGNHDQHNTVTSVNQREAGQMDDLDELFLMIDDMVLLDKTAESPGERSSSDILNSFNVEDYIELLQEDGDHASVQTNERSLNVQPNESPSCTNKNPNLVVSNDASTNLEPYDMFMAEQTNSSAGKSTPQEQDWDEDLIETLFAAADSCQK